MKTILCTLLWIVLTGITSVASADSVCDEQNPWWPYCNDQATGPDPGSAEYLYSQRQS